MAQQNIDFGAFPDDPSADAIRSAFQKVQENFDEVYTGITSASVSSVNRSVGAGITVNAPTGNVVVTANIANVTISSPNLQVGTSLGILASSTVYTSSTQTLYIVVPNTFSIGNIVLSGSANINGNLSVGGNVNLGNAIVANYFIGSGNNLSNIQGANVTGAVPTATNALTVTSNSQPNITSLGTLTSLSVSGNVTSGNANLGNAVTANYFIGSGANLTNIPGANVTGTAANANYALYAGDVVTSAQPNITSTGTLASLSVSGNANIGNIGTAGIISVTGNGTFGNVSATLFTGNLSSSGNSNVGNLGATGLYATTLSTTGNSNVGNLGATGVYATTLDGALTTSSQPNITSLGTLTLLSVSGNANIGNIGTTGTITTTGNIIGGNLATPGTLSVTGNTTLGNLSVTGTLNAGDITVSSISNGTSNVDIIGSGGNVTTSVNGISNVFIVTSTGANVTGTISTSGNSTVGNLDTTGLITATGNINGGNINTSGTVTASSLVSNVATGTAPFTVSSTTQVANLNVATAGVAGTVTTNAQPNITSVGNLTNLTSNGNVNFTNASDVSLGSNTIVHITGGLAGQVLSTDGSGNLDWVTYAGSPIAGSNTEVQFKDTSGNLGASANFTFNKTTNTLSVTTITATTANVSGTINASNIIASGNINGLNLGTGGNITASGNIQGSYILGNGSQLSGLPSGTGIANGTSSVNVPTTNGNVVIASAGNTVANITGTGINVAGTLSVSGNADVGNLGTTGVITSTGNITGGNLVTVGVVSATGNVTGNFFIGNGSQLTGIDATSIQNGNSNVKVFANANVTISSAGNANIVVVTSTGAIVNGTLSTTGNSNVGNLGTGGVITSSGNITGGNLITAGLVSATGNGTFGNISTGGTITSIGNVTAPYFLGNVVGNISGNLVVPGTNTSVLFNQDGNAGASDAFKFNYSSNTLLVTGAATVTGNANIANIGTGGLITATGNITAGNLVTSGVLSATGNINGGNLITGGLITATGNITGGNLVTVGIVSATGNVTGNFFIGNGSQLTGIDATSIQNGNSNVKVFANANVTVSSAGNANIVTVTGTGANIAGTLSASGNANVGNLGTSQLTATGNVALSGANVSLGAVGNLKITGGTANYFLQTDGSGNLTWATSSATVAGAYTFTQITPATTWVINHNLGYQYVNIELVDSTGNSFTGRYNYPTITFNNATHCTVIFDSAQAGYAAVSSGGGAQGPTGPTPSPGGSNTQVQFNDAGVLGGSSAFTFNKSSNLVSMTSLSITANANVGNIGGGAGVFSTISGNLTTPSQSNITAVGTLSSLSVTANANVGNLYTGGLVSVTGNVTGANIIATTYDITGVNVGISAAGSTQGTATALTKAFNVVSSVSAGQGVVLPTAVAGMRVTIVNTSANTVIIYPAAGGTINSLATNAGHSLPTVGRLDYIATSTTQWYAMGAIYV